MTLFLAVDPCPHRPPCPGCPRFGSGGIASEALETLSWLAKSNALAEPLVHEAPAQGYRHRARLAVRGRATSPKIGIFQEGSHRIVDIPSCVVHHPLINEVARGVKRAMKQLGVPPYSDMAHAGLVRYLQVVVERSSQTAQVVIVTNGESFDAVSSELCNLLVAELGEQLQGLFWNGNPERNNAILGPHWQHVHGAETVSEQIAGARVLFPPGAFGQSNLGLYERLVKRIHEWASEAPIEHVAELYAGTGTIGLGLAPRSRTLALNEISEASLHGLGLGILALPSEIQSRVRIAPGSAAAVADELLSKHPDLLIADPPRKGLDAEVTAAILRHRPERFIYVSCDLQSFCRDAEILISRGYALKNLEAFALFPYTDHVETLALFEHQPATLASD